MKPIGSLKVCFYAENKKEKKKERKVSERKERGKVKNTDSTYETSTGKGIIR